MPNETGVTASRSLLDAPVGPRERTTALAIGRIGAAALIATDLTLFVAAIPSRYRELLSTARSVSLPGEILPAGYAVTAVVLEVLVVVSLSIVAALIVWRRTWNAPAVLFAAVFVGYAVWVTPTLDALDLGAWWPVGSMAQAAGQLLAVLFFFAFPDGRFVPRWTIAVGFAWAAYALAWAVDPGAPFSLIDPFTATVAAFVALMFGGWSVGLGAQFVRYRGHADEEQRRQTKVVMLVIGAACLGYAAVYVPWILIDPGDARTLFELFAIPVFWLFALPIPIAITVAMLRHRLFGVSVVIVRTIVFGILAVFIAAVYVAIVVGIGSLVTGTGRPSLGLSLAATAVVALAFQPVRAAAQRFANQLVYGRRASPYDVLSGFATYIGEVGSPEDLLPVTARVLGEGTRAESASVWLRLGDELHERATWPDGPSTQARALAVDDDGAEAPDGDALFLLVRDRGELLGALSVRMPEGEEPSTAEADLARNLASQAGLVLRNVRLTEELRERVREVRASRQRIVTAQDRERRRLERDIHDGAQQRLVAMAVKSRMIASMLGDRPASERALGELHAELLETLEELRDLARGIFPPLLTDEGLAAALGSQARKAPIPVEVRAEGIGRYPQEAEVAVYFCVLEALQNTAKYAGATRARVELEAAGGRLVFRVRDDGAGFDPSTTRRGSGLQNMTDRIAALGGELDVRSSTETGTEVSGWVPAEPVADT